MLCKKMGLNASWKCINSGQSEHSMQVDLCRNIFAIGQYYDIEGPVYVKIKSDVMKKVCCGYREIRIHR